MRLENSIKNVIVALSCNIITIIISFITQNILVNTLGIEYSGLNGVFTNIITMLSIVELGIGVQIIFHLYKPIAEKDNKKIKALMNFYRKCYNTIAIIIAVLGLSIMPFINFFIGDNNITENIYLVYFLFILDLIISYLISYKRSILYANQKNRYIDIVHIIYVLIMNSLQIVALYKFKNYIMYLVIKIACRLLENILINIIASKMYPEIMKNNKEELDKNTVDDIKKRVKALVFHRVGGYFVLGIDSILVSKFFGLATAGIYANYTLITNAAKTLLAQMFSVITSSVGNLLVENNKEKSYQVYKKIEFLNFWIFGLASIGMVFTINPLITLWIGEKYIFTNLIVTVFALNFFFQGMRQTMETFSAAGGICYENRHVPILEAVVNLTMSFLFIKLTGLVGVFIGTILSSFVLHFYSFPKYIYNPLFGKKKSSCILEFFKYVGILLITYLVVLVVLHFINFENALQQLIINGIVCLVIVNIIFYILFRKTEEFKYYIDIIKKIINSKLNRKK